MANIPPFSANILEELAKFFGNIHSHSAIEMILRNASLFDPGQSFSKWKRLYNVFADSQKKHNVSNNVIKYICLALRSKIAPENVRNGSGPLYIT